VTILDTAYRGLVRQIFAVGTMRPSRVGLTLSAPGLSLFTAPIELEFPIITTRKIFCRGVVGELAAFLKGARTLQEFKDFGCPYWDHNAKQWWLNDGVREEEMVVGKIYGAQWRTWGVTRLDQLQMLVDGLKADPHGRRHILTTWNPEELDQGCLPPCHLLAQFYVRNDSLDCIIYMRSVDVALGLPSDLVLYGVLLMLVANHTGYRAGRLHFQFGDAHIYQPHLKKLGEQIERVNPDKCAPRAVLDKHVNLFDFHPVHFLLTQYNPMEAIKYVLL
jgi:thymidylate synthase